MKAMVFEKPNEPLTLQEWATPLTPVNYTLLGGASGFMLATVFAAWQTTYAQGARLTLAEVLTGLQSKRAFDDALDYSLTLAHKHGRQLAVMMMDLDGILADMAARGIKKKSTFFFGGVAQRDLYDLEKLATFEQRIEGFRFIPSLGRPDPGEPWDGAVGLVTHVVADHYEDMTGMEAYLCGSPGMIEGCITVLMEKGVAEEGLSSAAFPAISACTVGLRERMKGPFQGLMTPTTPSGL